MTPVRIENITDKILVGKSVSTSIINDQTGPLFRSFMPRRKEIPFAHPNETWDLKIYPDDYFQTFRPDKAFVKWVLVEVDKVETPPEGMEVYHFSGGQYAVFDYKGPSGDPAIFQYIFTEWIPQSNYRIDNRPHFDILGPKTKLGDPNSEEEIWIPII